MLIRHFAEIPDKECLQPLLVLAESAFSSWILCWGKGEESWLWSFPSRLKRKLRNEGHRVQTQPSTIP